MNHKNLHPFFARLRQNQARSARWKRWLPGIYGITGLLLITGLAAYTYLRRSLPMTRGAVKIAGLKAKVDIIRGKNAIPHIYAQHTLDAFCGLGYVHAQDRLWQMEFLRRVGQGRLSEVFGRSTLNNDIFLRSLGMYRVATTAWQKLSPEIKARVEAYLMGVNAFIAACSPDRLPPEFSLLRLKPEKWTGPQIMVLSKVMSWQLGGNFDIELLRSQLIQSVGLERARQILPSYPLDGPNIVQWSRACAGPVMTSTDNDTTAETASGSYKHLGEIEQTTRQMFSPGASFRDIQGSNSWVIDGTMSTTGKPLLANDPHLGIEIPLTWYLAYLSAPGLDVVGATIPGSPAVVIGRNKFITWGMTNLNPDVQDLFRERLDQAGKCAEFQGQMEEMHIYDEIINVKGDAPVHHQVRVTRHGPLVSDALNKAAENRSIGARKPALEPLALRWTALNEEDSTVEAFMHLNEAQNWNEFKDALRLFVSPGQNFIYADVDGNIGYHASGLIPIRASGDGSVPGEGWSGRNEWIGYVPFDELPHTYNPPEHYIVAANQRPAPPDYPYFLGREWSSTYRTNRIEELLTAKNKFSLQDFIDMQADTLSTHACELLPYLLPLVTPHDAFARSALDLMKVWDKNMAGNSPAAAIYGAWFRLIPRAVLKDELEEDVIANYEWRFQFVGRFITQTFARYHESGGQAESQIDCAAIANQTFHQALQDIKARLGLNQRKWRWSDLHHLMLIHQPLGRNRYLAPFLNRKVSSQGDCGTLNYAPIAYEPAFQQFGASGYRQIVDLARPEQSLFMQLVGQSGHFLSPHYADYLPSWKQMKYHPMSVDRALLEKSGFDLLCLQPGEDMEKI